MNERRHNTQLIVTVLSACVALMCGVSAAQAAASGAPLSEKAVRRVLNGSREAGPQLFFRSDRETPGRAGRLIRFGNFDRSEFFHLLDLSAALPRLDLSPAPDSFITDLPRVGENTHSLALPINFSVVPRLPRAGLI